MSEEKKNIPLKIPHGARARTVYILFLFSVTSALHLEHWQIQHTLVTKHKVEPITKSLKGMYLFSLCFPVQT